MLVKCPNTTLGLCVCSFVSTSTLYGDEHVHLYYLKFLNAVLICHKDLVSICAILMYEHIVNIRKNVMKNEM